MGESSVLGPSDGTARRYRIMKNKFKIIDASSGEKLKLGEGKANEL